MVSLLIGRLRQTEGMVSGGAVRRFGEEEVLHRKMTASRNVASAMDSHCALVLVASSERSGLVAVSFRGHRLGVRVTSAEIGITRWRGEWGQECIASEGADPPFAETILAPKQRMAIGCRRIPDL